MQCPDPDMMTMVDSTSKLKIYPWITFSVTVSVLLCEATVIVILPVPEFKTVTVHMLPSSHGLAKNGEPVVSCISPRFDFSSNVLFVANWKYLHVD